VGAKKRPKWGRAGRSYKKSTSDVAISLIQYMELAKAAREYLNKEKRSNVKIDFRLQVEAEFCLGILFNILKVTRTFVVGIQKEIHADKKVFEGEVKRFSDGAVPEKSVLVTKNLEGEMGQIIRRDKNLERVKLVGG